MKSLIALALAGYLVCGVAARTVQAQKLPPTATGKSYIIAFPKPLTNLYDLRFPNLQVQEKLTLHLYSDHSTTVVITPPGGGSDITVVLNGEEFEEVRLPVTSDSYVDQTGVVSGNAWRVRSRRPILVYCHMTGPFGAESWTPLPIESWGERVLRGDDSVGVDSGRHPRQRVHGVVRSKGNAIGDRYHSRARQHDGRDRTERRD